jgi:hypothetical protein
MKRYFLFPVILFLALLAAGCQAENQVGHLESGSAIALAVDADTLLPSLTFQEAETPGG